MIVYTRRNSKKLFNRHSRLDIRKFVFNNGVVDNRNRQSHNCVSCTAINSSKMHIGLHRHRKPDRTVNYLGKYAFIMAYTPVLILMPSTILLLVASVNSVITILPINFLRCIFIFGTMNKLLTLLELIRGELVSGSFPLYSSWLLMRWLQLRFDFRSTIMRRFFDRLCHKVTVT